MRNNTNIKRKTAMDIRLKKVRDRKRLKLGLPLIEDNSSFQDVNNDPEIDKREEPSIEDSVMESLKKLREDQEVDNNKKSLQNKSTVREWDLGKEGVDSIGYEIKSNARFTGTLAFGQEKLVEKPLLSQKEWVENKRQQRDMSFAPPNFYDKANRQNIPQHNSNKGTSNSDKSMLESKIKRYSNKEPNDKSYETAEIPISSRFDNGLPQWNPEWEDKNHLKKNKPIPTNTKLLQGLGMNSSEDCFQSDVTKTLQSSQIAAVSRTNEEDISVGHNRPLPDYNPGIDSRINTESVTLTPSLSLENRLNLHRDMMDNYGGSSTLGKKGPRSSPSVGTIKTEGDVRYTGVSGESSVQDEKFKRSKGSEVAPPITMEYFRGSVKKQNSFQFHRRNQNANFNSMKKSLELGMAKNAANTKISKRDLSDHVENDTDSD